MRLLFALLMILLTTSCRLQNQSQTPAVEIIEQDFESIQIGQIPTDYLVMRGSFSVQQADDGNHVLQLPGEPLNTFGLFFGPATEGPQTAQISVFTESKRRLTPRFAVGIKGRRGYRLRVVPGLKRIELLERDQVRASAEYSWQSGTWTHLSISVQKQGENWTVTGKVWPESATEPRQPMLSFDLSAAAPAVGRSSLWATPYSGKPTLFDNLRVLSVIE